MITSGRFCGVINIEQHYKLTTLDTFNVGSNNALVFKLDFNANDVKKNIPLLNFDEQWII